MPYALGDRIAAPRRCACGRAPRRGPRELPAAGWTVGDARRGAAGGPRRRRAVPAARRAARARAASASAAQVGQRLRVEHGGRHRGRAGRRLRAPAAADRARAAGARSRSLLAALGARRAPWRAAARRLAGRWPRSPGPVRGRGALLAAPRPDRGLAAQRHRRGPRRASRDSRAPNALPRLACNDAAPVVVWEAEGVESSVALQQIAALAFVVNGKVDGNARNDAPTQVMGGLLGALLHPGPRASLVIGLGTGSTAGWLAAVPAMERVGRGRAGAGGSLEVARAVRAREPRRARQPEVRIAIGDAREVLMTGRDQLRHRLLRAVEPLPRRHRQPLHPRVLPGGRRAPGCRTASSCSGCRPTRSTTGRSSTVLATLGSVFPEVEVWQVHGGDLLLVASVGASRPRRRRVRGRASGQEPFGRRSRVAWRARDSEDVLARFVAGPALARAVAAARADAEHRRPQPVEFGFARALARRRTVPRGDAAAVGGAGRGRPARIAGLVDWDRVEVERLAMHSVYDDPCHRTIRRPRPSAGPRDRARPLPRRPAPDGRRDLPAAAAAAPGPSSRRMIAEGLAERATPPRCPTSRRWPTEHPVEAEVDAGPARAGPGAPDGRGGRAGACARGLSAPIPGPRRVIMCGALMARREDRRTARPDLAARASRGARRSRSRSCASRSIASARGSGSRSCSRVERLLPRGAGAAGAVTLPWETDASFSTAANCYQATCAILAPGLGPPTTSRNSSATNAARSRRRRRGASVASKIAPTEVAA